MAHKRKRGQGTVRKRVDGRWEGRVVIGYDEAGKPKTKNVTAKTTPECLEKLKKLKEEVAPKKPVKISPSMLTGDWLDYWYQNYSKPTIRATTQVGYEQYLYIYAIPGIGHIPLNKLTTAELQKFFNELKRNGRINHVELKGSELSDHTVYSCFAVVRMALDRAVKENFIHTNPAYGCKVPSVKHKEMQVLTADEIRRFLIQAKEEGMYEIFLLDLTTGMRRGELMALRWDDLNFETGELRIDKQIYPVGGELVTGVPKTKNARRTIILPPAMLEILAEYKKGIFSEFMFPSRINPDKPLDPGYVRKRLQDILEHACCKKVRFHDLRHTFATLSLERGMDVKTLSTIIGHASSAVTLNTYAHITGEIQRNAAVSIDKGIAKAESSSLPAEEENKPEPEVYIPWRPARRRPGTGYVKQIGPNTWEGRYSPVWPDGKKHARNIYGKTEAECEAKLKELILTMKAEIAAERTKRKQ